MDQLEPRMLMAFSPSPAEQELLELINRFRQNPSAEIQFLINQTNPIRSPDPLVTDALRYFGTNGTTLATQWQSLQAAPPLAWNEGLSSAARTHNQLMIQNDAQSHQFPGEPDLLQRTIQAGYSDPSALGENLFAFAHSMFYGHAGLAIDWGAGPDGIQEPPGHRINLLNPSFREVGVSVIPESNPATTIGPLVITQVLGTSFRNEDPYLLGVAFRDLDQDRLYDVGEGLGDVTVFVTGANGSFSTITQAAGNYQLALPSGSYQVTFSGGALGGTIQRTVQVSADNVKVDAIPGVDPPPPPPPPPSIPLVGISSIKVNRGAIQRNTVSQLSIRFTGAVSIGPNAFEVASQGRRPRRFTLQTRSRLEDGVTIVDLTFLGAGVQRGSLPNGRFQLLVRASGVLDGAGRPIDGDNNGGSGGDRSFSFHRLAGDQNGDGVVNRRDRTVRI